MKHKKDVIFIEFLFKEGGEIEDLLLVVFLVDLIEKDFECVAKCMDFVFNAFLFVIFSINGSLTRKDVYTIKYLFYKFPFDFG